MRTRRVDEALRRLVLGGRVSKAWLGAGEEAVTVGAVHALRVGGHDGDVVAPMIRNSGACTEAGMPVADVIRAHLGTADAPSRGRDGHYGALHRGVLPPISVVGDAVPVTAGIALSFALRGERRVALTWLGDGASKTGAAHEGLNLAAVRRLPAIFVLQHNGIALGTRDHRFHRPARDGRGFRELPAAYGMAGEVVDGNDVEAMQAATLRAADRCRAGEGPVMLVAETFRLGGHATHDLAEWQRLVPPDEREAWRRRDPIVLQRARLRGRGVDEERLKALERAVEAEVEADVAQALASPMPEGDSALGGVYAEE